MDKGQTTRNRATQPDPGATTGGEEGRLAAELAALEARIDVLIAARDGARRALVAGRRHRPQRMWRHAREIASLAWRLTVARRDRARLRRGDRRPWPAPPAASPATSRAARSRVRTNRHQRRAA